MPRRKGGIRGDAPTEEKNPEAGGGVMVSEALGSLSFLDEVMEKEGLPLRTAQAIRQRFRERYPETREAIRKLATDDFIAKLSNLRMRLLESISDEDIKKATLAQRMVAFGIATEKELLIGGKPTHIVSVEDRRKSNELALALLREAQNRGIELMRQPDGSYAAGGADD